VREAFLRDCDYHLMLAYHVLICTGQRVSDAVRLKWEDYDPDARRIYLPDGQKKDRAHTPMALPVSKKLQRVLSTVNDRSGHLLTNRLGRKWNAQSLSRAIRNRLKELGWDGYTTHGLRKNAGIYLAENGANVPQIMAALGHKTPKMALYYCRLANQKLLADQVTELLDAADEKHDGVKVAKRRSGIKIVS
jgi:integrase